MHKNKKNDPAISEQYTKKEKTLDTNLKIC